MKIDLDVPDVRNEQGEIDARAKLSHFVLVAGPYVSDLLAVILFDCPTWFIPMRRRLALNDVGWINDLDTVNNAEDFDPWSQKVLSSTQDLTHRMDDRAETKASISSL